MLIVSISKLDSARLCLHINFSIQPLIDVSLISSSAPKEEKSEVKAILEQWQEEIKMQPAAAHVSSHTSTTQNNRSHFDDDVEPPPMCFAVDETDNADTSEAVALAAANALRGVELRSRDSNLQPDDQASVYDKVLPTFSSGATTI